MVPQCGENDPIRLNPDDELPTDVYAVIMPDGDISVGSCAPDLPEVVRQACAALAGSLNRTSVRTA